MSRFQQELEVGWIVIMTSMSCIFRLGWPVGRRQEGELKVRVSFTSTLKNYLLVQVIVLNSIQKNWFDGFCANKFGHLDWDLDIDDVRLSMLSITLLILLWCYVYYIIYFTVLAAKTNLLFYHIECGIIFLAIVYFLGN